MWNCKVAQSLFSLTAKKSRNVALHTGTLNLCFTSSYILACSDCRTSSDRLYMQITILSMHLKRLNVLFLIIPPKEKGQRKTISLLSCGISYGLKTAHQQWESSPASWNRQTYTWQGEVEFATWASLKQLYPQSPQPSCSTNLWPLPGSLTWGFSDTWKADERLSHSAVHSASGHAVPEGLHGCSANMLRYTSDCGKEGVDWANAWCTQPGSSV